MKQLITLALLVLVSAPSMAQEAHPDQTIPPLVENPNPNFGTSVDIDGDRAVIGASGSWVSGPLGGAAHVFERSLNGAWNEVQELVPTTASSFTFSGSSVAIEGDWLAMSSIANNSGSVTMYERQTSGVWQESTTLFPPVLPCLLFGQSIDIDGNRMVIASQRNDLATLGFVAVYERPSVGIWQLDSVVQPNSSSFQLDSIDLEGDRFVIGASKHSSASGELIVFERDTSGTWIEVAHVQAANPVPDAHLGASVELEGDLIIAGAPHHPQDVSAPAGTAHVFERRSNGTWSEVHVLVGSPSVTGDRFGRAMDLEGGRLVVGAPESNLAALLGGAVHVFERDPSGAFRHSITVVRQVAGLSDRLGNTRGVALDGSRVLASAFKGGTGVVEAFDIGSLYHSDVMLSLAGGGTQELFLRGPLWTAGDFYFLLGSASGTTPGIPLAPGFDLPLLFDAYTDLTLSLAIPIAGQFGVLDANGFANAAFNLPAGANASLAGFVLHHAYLTIDLTTFDVFASSAARIELVP